MGAAICAKLLNSTIKVELLSITSYLDSSAKLNCLSIVLKSFPQMGTTVKVETRPNKNKAIKVRVCSIITLSFKNLKSTKHNTIPVNTKAITVYFFQLKGLFFLILSRQNEAIKQPADIAKKNKGVQYSASLYSETKYRERIGSMNTNKQVAMKKAKYMAVSQTLLSSKLIQVMEDTPYFRLTCRVLLLMTIDSFSFCLHIE